MVVINLTIYLVLVGFQSLSWAKEKPKTSGPLKELKKPQAILLKVSKTRQVSEFKILQASFGSAGVPILEDFPNEAVYRGRCVGFEEPNRFENSLLLVFHQSDAILGKMVYLVPVGDAPGKKFHDTLKSTHSALLFHEKMLPEVNSHTALQKTAEIVPQNSEESNISVTAALYFSKLDSSVREISGSPTQRQYFRIKKFSRSKALTTMILEKLCSRSDGCSCKKTDCGMRVAFMDSVAFCSYRTLYEFKARKDG